MKSDFWKRIFKTSGLYLFGTVMAKLVSFFLLPLYTNKIPTEAYGTYDIVIAYAAIIVPLIGVNSWQGMLRFTVEEENVEKRHHIVSQGWLMLMISVVALSICYSMFCLFVSFQNRKLIFLYLISQLVQYFYIYTARGFGKNKIYAASGVISALAVAVSSIICIYCFHLTIEALYISLIASLLSQIIFIELNLHLLKDISLKKPDEALLRTLYKYCFPESIGTIFNWLLNSANRVIIVAVLGYAANGIYAISNKFLSILNVFMTAFILSFQETIYSAGPENIESSANDVLDKFAKLSGFAVPIILLGTSIVFPLFVAGDYVEGYTLIPIFYAYFLMSGLTWILSSVASATKKTQITLYEKIIIGIINFSIMFVSIRRLGLVSSPVSLFIAEACGIVAFKALLKHIAQVHINIPAKFIILDLLLIGLATVLYLKNQFLISIIAIFALLVLFSIMYRKQVRALIKVFSGRRFQ